MNVLRCIDCGADAAATTCRELFEVLLALDHSRREPWGPLHREAVACYFYDHPSDPQAPTDTAALREILREYLGVDIVDSATPMTIHDLAVDGTFPPDEYEDRLGRWARSILARRPRGRHD